MKLAFLLLLSCFTLIFLLNKIITSKYICVVFRQHREPRKYQLLNDRIYIGRCPRCGGYTAKSKHCKAKWM